MTAGAFDRLLYTDCRAGTGRGAGGGFQVQAQSAGVDAAQSKMAVGWLLYDAPTAWIVQRRPVEEFPLGFAHASVTGYGTAQSRYLGTEAAGGRQGNHLADCVLTHELALYGPTRPAQLWRSELWRSQAWDTTDCPPFDDTPPLGPLTVDAVAGWLRDDPARPPVLAKVVSALEEPAGRRIVIAADTPDEALRWIAAATLLLPIRAALDVSFKVFCSNPLQASHRIVAVQKELNPQVVPGRSDSLLVLDAERAISDEAVASRRASWWVDLLASAEDPYDVVDAVELAGQLGAEGTADPADALITAWAVTVPDAPLNDPETLLRWLSGADGKLQAQHGPAVVSRILATSPPAATLRWIDTAAAAGGIDTDRLVLRGTLLTAEIAEVRAGGTPPADLLSDVGADADARRDADSELSSAIVLSADPHVDQLLRLARRHGVELQLPPLQDRLLTFAAGWIDHPGRDYRPERWALREEVLDLVQDQLQVRLAEQGAQRLSPAIRRMWRYLAGRPGDLADPLYRQLQVAAVAGLKGQERLDRLSLLMQQARSATTASAISGIQRALIEWQALGPTDAVHLLLALPPDVYVAPEVMDAVVDGVLRPAARVTGQLLDAIEALYRRNWKLDDRFAYLLAGDRNVKDFMQAAATERFWKDSSFCAGWLHRLGSVEPTIINARLGRLVQTCLDRPAPGLGAAVIDVLPSTLPRLFIDRWGRELRGEQVIRATIEGIHWYESAILPGNLRAHVAEVIAGYGSELDLAAREEWFVRVREGIPPDLEETWARLAGFEEPSRHRGRRGRGKGEW